VDTGRQIIRWSIPGSIIALLAFAVNLVSALAERRIRGDSDLALTLSTEVVALVTLATIPIGYAVYQYYYSRDGRVRLFPPSLVPIDRGYVILRTLAAAGQDSFLDDLGAHRPAVPAGQAQLGTPGHARSVEVEEVVWGAIFLPLPRRLAATWRQRLVAFFPPPAKLAQAPGGVPKQRVYLWRGLDIVRLRTTAARGTWWHDLAERHQAGSFRAERRRLRHDFYDRTSKNNEVVRSALAVLAVGEAGAGVLAEYTALSDIYHGLGATRTAIALGYPLGVLSTLVASDRTTIGNVTSWIICGLASAFLYWKLHRNRSQVLVRLLDTTTHGLIWLNRKRVKDAGAATR